MLKAISSKQLPHLVASVTLLNVLLRSRSQRQILLVLFRENGLAFQREPLLDKLLLSALSLLLDHGTIFDLRVLVQLAFAALSTCAVFGHVRTVMLFVLPSEVIAQRLIAQVALHEPATTRHLVTTYDGKLDFHVEASELDSQSSHNK